jgi:Carboxypeptidase regulatory-like domain
MNTDQPFFSNLHSTAIISAIILALLFSSLGWGQGVSGVISGRVTNPKDAAGIAVVTITNADTGVVAWTGKTNAAGLYRAPNLPAGRYDIDATARGFKHQHVSGIELSVGERADVLIVMQAGEGGETVAVEGAQRASWSPTVHRSARPSRRPYYRICLCPAAIPSICLL